MTDFKSAAEQQVRETLGWWTYCPTAPHEVRVFNFAVSKTAELLEMTAQRDELAEILQNYKRAGAEKHEDLTSAEATIREQAERIKELEEALSLTQSLSSQIWDAAEVAWKEGKTETEASNER